MKDKLLDKIAKNNYNNKLEEVLLKKNFSPDVKNTLLSMFYKIESGYNDYFTVKRDVFDKKEYIAKLIKIIEKDCKYISFIKPNSKENESISKRGFLVNKAKKEILCYPIDVKILYAIAKIQKMNVVVKYLDKDLEETLSKMLNIGNNINMVEPLRDFNGFSWNIVIKEIESIDYNLIYQNMLFLMGNKFLDKWVNNYDKMVDYFDLFQSKVKPKTIDRICKLALLIEMKNNENFKKIISKKEEEFKKEYEEMQQKENYLLKLAENKKKIEGKIKDIDKTVSNKRLLLEEYEKRNEKLPLEKKIFSIRILKEILNKERIQLLKEIEFANQLMRPRVFLQKRKEVKQKLELFEVANIEDMQKEIEKQKIQLQKDVLENLLYKIQNVQEKNELINIIYIFRYYNLLPINTKTHIYESSKLKNEINKITNVLIKQAINMKVMNQISIIDQVNNEIIKNIFYSRIISLEDINIKITKEKNELYLELYDENILESKVKLNEITKEELKIKLNKKVKLFI